MCYNSFGALAKNGRGYKLAEKMVERINLVANMLYLAVGWVNPSKQWNNMVMWDKICYQGLG
jgi:hypothetical protein